MEQRNWTHVRQLFGYERVESKELVALMNDIYVNHWLPLHNYFLPSFKLISKNRLNGKIKKLYDLPQTPCQRLLQSEHLSEHRKKFLRSEMKKLNPFKLRADLETKLKEFFKLLHAAKYLNLAA